ncbi:MAG: DNA glycosylase AlkZ-like family protein [Dongiaceae bacterium]
MSRVNAVELRRFLFDRLGLSGAPWPAEAAADKALDLGMIQIDSIRSTGLRNHELAWLARSDQPVSALYDLMYRTGRLLESHYPLFATRRDWLPMLGSGLNDVSAGHRAARRRYRPLMGRLVDQMRRDGPVTVAQFSARRVPGGFNTIKATTKALELLFHDRAVQIAGRTANFHRIFDLTERIAPELNAPSPIDDDAYERFLLESALTVLKIATADQIADRVALHFGSWRGESIHRWRALTARLLPELARSVTVVDFPGQPEYWYRPADEAAWHHMGNPDGFARLVAPLDNLLFSRRRFSALFGFDYKFEAYTPVERRRFYFAMPIAHDSDIVGLVDGKLDREGAKPVWRITGLELSKPVPVEALRAGIHRIARLAGAERVAVATSTTRALRQALTGDCGPRGE